MSKLILRTIINNHVSQTPLTNNTIVQAREGALYEVIDEQGNLVSPTTQGKNWQWLISEDGQTTLTIENYGQYIGETLMPIGSDAHHIMPAAEISTETVSDTVAVKASTINTTTSSGVSTTALWSIGALGAVGALAAAASGGKGGGSEQPTPSSQPSQPTVKPIITLDSITDDNIINIAESQQTAIAISGSVQHVNEGDAVTLHIGDAQYTAIVANGRFSVNVDGNTLANHQNIRATVNTHDHAGNTASETTEHAYSVDTHIDRPILELDDITGDNIINREESLNNITILGTAHNVADGTEVIVSCGCPSCAARLGTEAVEKTTIVHDGRFSVDFAGGDLIADGRHMITAKVVVQDDAGNIAEAQVAQGYTVDTEITSPIITLDSVTDDNIINIAESQQTAITISGSVQHVNEGDAVTLHIGDAQYTAIVANGRFSVNVDGNTLANHQNIRATVNTHDHAGNTASETTEHAYSVDTHIDRPILELDDITGDNIINREESLNNITILGTAHNVADGTEVIVSCGCPSCAARLGTEAVEKTTIVHDGRFSVDFAGGDLIADGRHMITASVVVRDDAGNIAHGETAKGYTVAVERSGASLTWNNIANDNIINAAESKEKITLSGRINGLKNSETATVVIKVGDETLAATVDNGHYSVQTDANKLAGNNTAQAIMTVRDNADNHTEFTSVQHYRYDTEINAPKLTVDNINGGNILNHQDSLGQTIISGTLTHDDDVLADQTRVTVTLNGEAHQATVSGSHWQLALQGSRLTAQQGNHTVNIDAQITDEAGNTAHSRASTQYQTDTIAPTAHITLNPIAGDNVLNITETSQNITLSGTVSGEFKAGDIVTLNANGKTIATTVQENGSFSTEVKGSDLATDGTHNVSATIALHDDAGNEGSAAAQTHYTVEAAPKPPVVPTQPTPTASIRLNNIDPSTWADDAGITHIGGRINLTGDFAIGMNKSRLHGIAMLIGNKHYSAVIDPQDQTFNIDIPNEDLPLLQGQTVAYQFDTDSNLYRLKARYSGSYQYEVESINTPQLNVNHVQLDSNSPIQNGRFQTNHTPGQNTNISGIVSGSAKAGDVVVLTIGSHTFETTVNNNLSFQHNVNKKILANNNSIHAVLKHDDAVLAQTEMSLSDEPEISAKFVSGHQFDTKNGSGTYFIDSLLYENIHSDDLKYPIFHARKAPFDLSQTAVLKYFVPAADAAYSPFTEEQQNAVKTALDDISSYANIRFEQSTDPNDVDIGYTIEKIKGGANGLGYPGGRVIIGEEWVSNGKKLSDAGSLDLIRHETLHSLGLEHPFDGKVALSKAEDHRRVSVMSYTGDGSSPGLGAFDIAFLHYRFGVNPNVRTGNDVYRFKPVNPNTHDKDVYIWDGGGVDTFDASDQTEGVHVNLTPGSWIYAGKKTDHFLVESRGINNISPNEYFDKPQWVRIKGNISSSDGFRYTKNQAFIGFGTQIEKLIGSAHDDVLTGNHANNIIHGGSGNDTIDGGKGNDYLYGDKGNDTLTGGEGRDVFVFHQPTEGVDTITDFKAGEDHIQLSLPGFDSIHGKEDIMQHIHYNEATGKLTYNHGTNTPIHFATISQHLNITGDSFILNGSVQDQSVPDNPPTPTNPEIPKPPVSTTQPHSAAEIDLNNIDATGLYHNGFTRIGGKINLNGGFEVGHNKERVYSLTVKIGSKSYTAPIHHDTQTFTLDIPDADLSALEGQKISYHFDTSEKIYTPYYSHGHYDLATKTAPILDESNVVWNEGSPIANGRFTAPIDHTVEISGTVSGAAKAGDTVVLTAGTQTVETTVQSDLTFRHSLNSKAVAEGIQATVKHGNNVLAKTEATISSAPEVGSEYVTVHKHDNNDTKAYLKRPYFLNALMGVNDLLSHVQKNPFNPAKTTKLTFSMPTWGENNGHFLNFTPENKQAVRNALDIIKKYANIEFTEIITDSSNAADADISYRLGTMSSRINGFGEYGGPVTINKLRAQESGGGLNRPYNMDTLLHETMHSLGAKHSFEGGTNYYQFETLHAFEEKRSLTQMSYTRDKFGTKEMRIYDLAFLHYRFGVNPNARTDDDIYHFKPFNPNTPDNDIYIWDGGGVDTFDASDQMQGVTVNLTPGSWIHSGAKTERFAIDNVHSKYENFEGNYIGLGNGVSVNGQLDETDYYVYTKGQAFIGYGTQIEKLIGSEYNDTLSGNHADNIIYGGAGDDQIKGDGGNDYLDGGKGADHMAGNTGDDTYVVDQKGDQITELANEGNDTVHSYINYTLNEHVENLYLFGTQALNATGNDANNELKGNGANNVLDGKGGSDTLTGGMGKDTFVFSQLLEGSIDTITDFTVGEDKIALTRSVFSAVKEGHILDNIHYESSNGHLSYNNHSDTQHFATIGTGLQIDENSFSLI